MTPDLTAGSRRARLRQDRSAPLRGGLRPILTQSLLGALITLGWGEKRRSSVRTKSTFWLAIGAAIKERRNAAQPNQENPRMDRRHAVTAHTKQRRGRKISHGRTADAATPAIYAATSSRGQSALTQMPPNVGLTPVGRVAPMRGYWQVCGETRWNIGNLAART